MKKHFENGIQNIKRFRNCSSSQDFYFLVGTRQDKNTGEGQNLKN